MRIDKPRTSIRPQIQTTAPVTSDATIMDDTVATMESLTALMGGQTVTHTTMRSTTDIAKPRGIGASTAVPRADVRVAMPRGTVEKSLQNLTIEPIYPHSRMRNQVQTSRPTTSDSTIMDDTVITMDSTTALMGGLAVDLSATRQTLETVVPRPIIKISR